MPARRTYDRVGTDTAADVERLRERLARLRHCLHRLAGARQELPCVTHVLAQVIRHARSSVRRAE